MSTTPVSDVPPTEAEIAAYAKEVEGELDGLGREQTMMWPYIGLFFVVGVFLTAGWYSDSPTLWYVIGLIVAAIWVSGFFAAKGPSGWFNT